MLKILLIALLSAALVSCAGWREKPQASVKALDQQIEYHEEEARKARSAFNERAAEHHECMANKLREKRAKIGYDFLDFMADVLFGPAERSRSQAVSINSHSISG